MLIWFLPLFLLFLLIGLPVFFGLLAAPGILLWLNDQGRDGAMLYRNIYNGIDSFPLMAIPFFMLAGELMNRGGITLRLVEFSQAMMGHLKGGLAHVNVLTSMLFAGLSGSAVADTSAIGSMLIPAMEKQGYTKKFTAAITAASSVKNTALSAPKPTVIGCEAENDEVVPISNDYTSCSINAVEL